MNTFIASLKEIQSAIHLHDYPSAVGLMTSKQKEIETDHQNAKLEDKTKSKRVKWLLSIAYCLSQLTHSDQAMQMLEQCLNYHPHHTPSLRRLAKLHEKSGNPEKALEYYKRAELYEPDSPLLIQKIYKLEAGPVKPKMPMKMVSADNIPAVGEIQKQHVTFGTSKIIQMTSDNSDQYFAHIQQELSRLNQIKPKKSILKTSASYQKQTNEPQGHLSENQDEKEELPMLELGKSLSIKSCRAGAAPKWQEELEEQLQIKPKKAALSVAKKQKKKKKAVSFCYLDTNERDP